MSNSPSPTLTSKSSGSHTPVPYEPQSLEDQDPQSIQSAPTGSQNPKGSFVTQEGLEKSLTSLFGEVKELFQNQSKSVENGFNGVLNHFGDNGIVRELNEGLKTVKERVVKDPKPKVGQDQGKSYKTETVLMDLTEDAQKAVRASSRPKKMAQLANNVLNPNTKTNEQTVLGNLVPSLNKMGSDFVAQVVEGGRVSMDELAEALGVDKKDQQKIENALFKHFAPTLKEEFKSVFGQDIEDINLKKVLDTGLDAAFDGIGLEYKEVKSWLKNSGRYTFFLGALFPALKGSEQFAHFLTLAKAFAESNGVTLESLMAFVKQYGLSGFTDYVSSYISLETALLIGGGIMVGFLLDWLWEKWSTTTVKKEIPRTQVETVKV